MNFAHLTRRLGLVGMACAAFGATPLTLRAQSTEGEIAIVRQGFENPPDDCRIMMRWWWFGPSVTKEELERELRLMREGGIGGVEVQTTYPLGLDDAASGMRNYAFLSKEHLDNLRFAEEEARALGLRLDLTLGSGWPYGGPSVPVEQAAGLLRVARVPVQAGEDSAALPDIETGEKLVAAFLARGEAGKLVTDGAQRLTHVRGGRVLLPKFEGSRDVLFFIASHTGQQVKRAALGAEGFVLDPYNRAATDDYLHAVGDRLLSAFGAHPPYAIFSDSLEVYDSDWTPDLLKEFRERRGYDLTPYLPELVGQSGTQASEVRHDWGETLTELTDENYLKPIHEWAETHGTRFRSQTYGTPPATLSSNALVDLPEGEGWNWKGFSAVRWASSASHLYGRQVTSSETWTWLHSPVFRATPLDMKAAADKYFLEGSNDLIGHGWPYSPKTAGEPGWHFYAAAVFNEQNPWWLVMPDVTRYLQRVSFLLRQGKPANDVALLLPTDDAWAEFTATVAGQDGDESSQRPTGADISLNEGDAALLGQKVIPQILDAGFNFDFIDAGAIDRVGVRYPILVLANIERLPLATYRKIEAYADKGGAVIATGRLPSIAPGLKQTEKDSPLVREISRRLFRDAGARGHFVQDEAELGHALAEIMKPDVSMTPPEPGVGFVRRRLAAANLYFFANTTNRAVRTQVMFREPAQSAEMWNPVTGETRPASGGEAVELNLAPYESRAVVLSREPAAKKPRTVRARTQQTLPPAVDISRGWEVTFTGLDRTEKMSALRSWTDESETKFYSGLAEYRKTVEAPAAMLKPGVHAVLDFGAGTPVAMPTQEAADEGGTGSTQLREQAWLDGPVREAAKVYVNDQLAGDIWMPPYEIDVTRFLRVGRNTLRIVVANLAINEMAGRGVPQHRLLYDRYGKRFADQDMEHLKPIPAGILGTVRLEARPATK